MALVNAFHLRLLSVSLQETHGFSELLDAISIDAVEYWAVDCWAAICAAYDALSIDADYWTVSCSVV